MRQWMVDPRAMCRKHLLGEHVEHHMYVGTIRKGGDLRGFLTGNLLEPASLGSRHDELAAEMTARGYQHLSPLPEFKYAGDLSVKIDRQKALSELLRRCPECRQRFETLTGR